MRYVMTMTMVCAVMSAAAQAQDVVLVKQAAEREAVLAKVQNMRVSVETRQTRNAPYSAEAVTESVQQLADGNRIVTRNATRIYRDGEGRTRREQLNGASTDATAINISDPVAGTTYALDPASRTAYRSGVFTTTAFAATSAVAPDGARTFEMTRVPAGGVMVTTRDKEMKEAAEAVAIVEGKQVAEIRTRVAGTTATVNGVPGAGGTVTYVAGGAGLSRIVEDGGKTTRVELGQQTIEGVVATGTRSTTEIAAGAIGNEQPIKIVSEQWYSPELQVLVLTKHLDPRVGETVYRLTGIVRAEPAHSLFELPADYTLKESLIRRQQQ